MIDYIFSFFIITIEFIALLNITNSFCEYKLDFKKTIAVSTVGVLVFVASLSVFTYFNVWKALFTIFIHIIFLSLIFKGKFFSKLFSIFIFSALNIRTDFVVISFITEFTSITLDRILHNFYANAITTILAKFIFTIVAFVFCKYFRQYKTPSEKISVLEWILILLFPAISILLLSTILYTSLIVITLGPISLVITVAIFLANVAILLIITKLAKDKQIKQDNALLNQQIKMGMENIEALNSAYTQQRKLTHDFNNHLSVIRSLLDGGDTAQAKEYTANLLNTSISVSRLFDSGNRIVDTLLTQKYNRAKAQGINMQVLVEDLSSVAISGEKLVVVLSNLLDNAIEAAAACKDEKIIKVKFVLENTGHILTVQNTTDAAPATDSLQTTKQDKLSHGYGTKNIRSVLDSYGYPYSFSHSNGWFSFTAMMME